jgi:hypothetical protein
LALHLFKKTGDSSVQKTAKYRASFKFGEALFINQAPAVYLWQIGPTRFLRVSPMGFYA